MYETRCLWRSTAAFGAPVVPLVKSRIAISSGSIDQSGARRARRARAREEVARATTALHARRAPPSSRARSASVTR